MQRRRRRSQDPPPKKKKQQKQNIWRLVQIAPRDAMTRWTLTYFGRHFEVTLVYIFWSGKKKVPFLPQNYFFNSMASQCWSCWDIGRGPHREYSLEPWMDWHWKSKRTNVYKSKSKTSQKQTNRNSYMIDIIQSVIIHSAYRIRISDIYAGHSLLLTDKLFK